ncbi:MAG: ATP-binding cassette domain-containing protein [Candidatus Bathyarchaeota archaeon]|nr:ATP-binding cassette domain-containing protein [Candidatus Bathyarchaeota archaeon]MDH5734187.1 ATP-binding cassette domain-containing protein [Candidatus Bathyarchaeota archaeon]
MKEAIITSDILLKVRGLKKHFRLTGRIFKKAAVIRAVDGVSFDIHRGETLGLVGESGCGKTTTGLTILRFYPPTAGSVYFEGKDIFQTTKREMRKLRQEMQMIFQDPFLSLNPRMTVYDIIGDAFDIHGLARGAEKDRRIISLMKKVELIPHHMYRYPHEFSGGQRQRIGIARALALKPKFVIADEPVSSLDISVRAQMLNLLQDLQEEFELTTLYISHDLSTVKHICDRVCVMYLGRIIESADVKELFNNPLHPYTKALILAIPIPNPKLKRKRIVLKGSPPTPIDPPPGCRFHPRCPYTPKPICKKEEPELIDVGTSTKHLVACHFISSNLRQNPTRHLEE